MKIQIYYYSTYIYFPDEFEGFELQILIKRNNITKVMALRNVYSYNFLLIFHVHKNNRKKIPPETLIIIGKKISHN